MHTNSLLCFLEHFLPRIASKCEEAKAAGARDVDLLEVGACRGHGAYRNALPEFVDYHFCDIKNKSRHEKGFIRQPGEYEIATPDASFDVVLAGQVLEHVRRPWKWFVELARLLRPGGIAMTISPVNWALHRHPVDTARWLPDGIKELHAEAGLVTELAEICNLDTSGQHDRYQFNGVGKVLDLVAIGRKV